MAQHMICLPQISRSFPHTEHCDRNRHTCGGIHQKPTLSEKKKKQVTSSGDIELPAICIYILAQRLPYLVSEKNFFSLVNFWKTKLRKGLWVSCFTIQRDYFDRSQQYCCMLTFDILCMPSVEPNKAHTLLSPELSILWCSGERFLISCP